MNKATEICNHTEVDMNEVRILVGYLQQPNLERDYYPRLDGRLYGKLPLIAQALQTLLAERAPKKPAKKPATKKTKPVSKGK